MANKEVAERLEVTPKYLSRFLNEEVNIEPNFAVRLAKATGFCVGTWLELQRKYNSTPKRID
jgi:addiction module HigA family antidote